LHVAHYEMGIGKYFESDEAELYFFKNILGQLIGKEERDYVFFDVGANTGEYTLRLASLFPSSHIFSFEPNPRSNELMISKTTTLPHVRVIKKGVGEKERVASIMTDASQPESQLASMVPGLMTDLHKMSSVVSFEVEVVTLDEYCRNNDIGKINFLKIDTEGYECNVLKGAASLIHSRAIDVIQIEVNIMNIYAGVFLKDLYEALPGYEFFRLDTKKIIPIGPYEPINEIFCYQNLIVINNSLTSRLV
jgi:FkbM family methyltransferase